MPKNILRYRSRKIEMRKAKVHKIDFTHTVSQNNITMNLG